MGWKNSLDRKDISSNSEGRDINIAPSERLLKDSRGHIDESTSWVITAGAGYIDRDLKVAGASEEDLWKKYVLSSWTRACVDKIIKETVKYRIRVEAKDSDKAEDAQVKRHITEVEKLLENPNKKVESFDDLRRKYLRDILVYDAGALEIVYTGKIPVEIYDLKGANIRLNLDKHGNFLNPDKSAYKLIDQNNYVKPLADFSIKELIYMISNPVSGSAYGLSPIETLWDDICNEIEAAQFNQRILHNSGLLSGVLAFQGMSEPELKKNRRYWMEELRRKGQKLIITNNPNVTFTRVSETQKDMQFLEYQKWLLNKIMAVYGMQPMVLGVVDITTGKLNSSEQREQFKQDAILPLLKLEAHRLTDVLVKQGFGFEDIKITHIEPENVNEEFDLEKMKEGGKLGVITINEARRFMNLQPLEDGGDVLIAPSTMAKIKALVEKQESHDEIVDIRNRIRDLLDTDETVELSEE